MRSPDEARAGMMTLAVRRRRMFAYAHLHARRAEPYRMHMPMLKRERTVDDLADLPDDGNRYEIIDGELFMTPAPSLRHPEAVARLYRLLSDYTATHRIGH